MTILQTIFTVSYSILYGIMLDSCGGLALFHFGYLFTRDPNKIQKRVGRRIIIAFLIINLSPISIFLFIYNMLGRINFAIGFDTIIFKPLIIISIFAISFIVFGFYRFYHVVMQYFDIYDPRIKTLSKCELKRIGLTSFKNRYEEMGPIVSGQLTAISGHLLATYFYIKLFSIGIFLFNFKLNRFSPFIYKFGYILFIITLTFIILANKINEKTCDKQMQVLLWGLIIIEIIYIYYVQRIF